MNHDRLPLPSERTMIGVLGFELFDPDSEGVVRGRFPVADPVLQPYGLVHGSAMVALAETLASFGTALGVQDEGKIAMGQEINASLLRSATAGHVHGTARVRRRGRSAWIWEIEITDDEERLCALVRATIAVRDPAVRGLGPMPLPQGERSG